MTRPPIASANKGAVDPASGAETVGRAKSGCALMINAIAVSLNILLIIFFVRLEAMHVVCHALKASSSEEV